MCVPFLVEVVGRAAPRIAAHSSKARGEMQDVVGWCVSYEGGMVTLLRDQTAVTGQAPFEALAAASHPPM
jgi:hypothetical protein